MKRIGLLGIVSLGAALWLSGCVAQPEVILDGGGVAMDEAFAQSLERQYAAAASRHAELNDFVAKLQEGYFSDEWEDSGIGSEVVPTGGQGFDPYMSVASNENSYVFMVHRYHEVEGDLEAFILNVADDWRARGWSVSVGAAVVRHSNVSATTPEGYWFSAREKGDVFSLTAYSPAYWGDPDALAAAVIERGEAESAAGVHGSKYARVDGFARLLPGAYRPFPEWDALEKYPPVSE